MVLSLAPGEGEIRADPPSELGNIWGVGAGGSEGPPVTEHREEEADVPPSGEAGAFGNSEVGRLPEPRLPVSSLE